MIMNENYDLVLESSQTLPEDIVEYFDILDKDYFENLFGNVIKFKQTKKIAQNIDELKKNLKIDKSLIGPISMYCTFLGWYYSEPTENPKQAVSQLEEIMKEIRATTIIQPSFSSTDNKFVFSGYLYKIVLNSFINYTQEYDRSYVCINLKNDEMKTLLKKHSPAARFGGT